MSKPVKYTLIALVVVFALVTALAVYGIYIAGVRCHEDAGNIERVIQDFKLDEIYEKEMNLLMLLDGWRASDECSALIDDLIDIHPEDSELQLVKSLILMSENGKMNHESIFFLNKSADRESWVSSLLLAIYYKTNGDLDKAIMFAKNAEEKSIIANNILMDAYIRKEDFTTAVIWIRKLADLGVPRVQAFLGLLYLEGKGVERDRDKGIQWIRKAADNGEVEAIKFLVKHGYM